MTNRPPAPSAEPTQAAPASVVADEAESAAPAEASGGAAAALEAFLPSPSDEPASREPQRPMGMRSAKVVGLAGRTATVYVRGEDQAQELALDPDVDAAVVREAMESGERVMVEADEEGAWVVVGVLRSRVPEKLRLTGETIEIEAEREVLLRAGTGAVRIRQDGDIEIVGSRISAASRGLFRLVGRMLRLN